MFTDMSTPEARRQAVKSLPRIMRYASEGNLFYSGLIYEITVSLTIRAMCPWMWNRTDHPSALGASK